MNRDTAQAISEKTTFPAARIAPQRVTGKAGEQRTPEERLMVRFPALAHALAPLLFRLSPQSRIRRLLFGRAIARAYAAANRRDFALNLVLNDEALYEYRPSRDLLPPDMATVYRGHEGYREFWRLWLDAFEDIRWDPEEILDLGDRALVTARQSGHGSGSGVAVSEPVYQLFTFRRGLVIRQEDFLDRRQALEAAGLSL